MLGAERRSEIAFFNRTRSRQSRRAAPASDLKSREPDPARPTMDKNPFAVAEAGTSDQAIIGGEKSDRDGDGGFERQASREPCHRPCVHRDMGGERSPGNG